MVFQLCPISTLEKQNKATNQKSETPRNCRNDNMGGWASLFSGLSRRIPDSLTQKAVATYFTGDPHFILLAGKSALDGGREILDLQVN